MKRLLIILLSLALIGGGGYFGWNYYQDSKTNSSNYEGWKTYNNQKYGFSFKYPPTWRVEEVSIASPSGADPVEFAANFSFNTNEKYNETGQVEIHKDSIDTVSKLYDNYHSQSSLSRVDKKSAILKGKNAVEYKITVLGVEIKIYLFEVGDKTYLFSSNNEELNQQRSITYWSDFDGVFNSLTIK